MEFHIRAFIITARHSLSFWRFIATIWTLQIVGAPTPVQFLHMIFFVVMNLQESERVLSFIKIILSGFTIWAFLYSLRDVAIQIHIHYTRI